MGVYYITYYLLISTLCYECVENSSEKHGDCINETEILHRAGKFPCQYPLRYHYIWSPFHGTYVEKCFLVHTIEQGYMTVIDQLSGNINNAHCLGDTFQPTPYKSNTQCGCALIKSTCDGIGQVISTNGSSEKDRTCRCDYLKGYTYVNIPADRCNCKPKGENCTCKLVECPNGSRLSPDYVCIENARYLNTNYSCHFLNENRISKVNGSIPKDETISEDRENSVTGIAVPIFTICILLNSVVSFSFGTFFGVNKWFTKIKNVTIKCCCPRKIIGTTQSKICKDEERQLLPVENNPSLEQNNVKRTSSNLEDVTEKKTEVNTRMRKECDEQSKTNMQRINSLPSRKDAAVDVQVDPTYQDDAKVNMPEELDIVVINLHGDMFAAEQYLTHLNQLCGNKNIHIELLHNAMNSGMSFEEVLSSCRHIFIFLSNEFKMGKFKDEKYFKHLEKKFFGESFNIERIKVVYSNLRQQIPEELAVLNTIPYTPESIKTATYIARMRNYFSEFKRKS
ncbi:uncharacterized protein LOC143067584 isoform X2 [Mytilus galloprovincialis]|uniref:uncharacterized protein LOC143067584 isoform X2 n=1 Tax=Mytilus galloprovincialis TaxID=29158 RepID=UPI003F7B9F34